MADSPWNKVLHWTLGWGFLRDGKGKGVRGWRNKGKYIGQAEQVKWWRSQGLREKSGPTQTHPKSTWIQRVSSNAHNCIKLRCTLGKLLSLCHRDHCPIGKGEKGGDWVNDWLEHIPNSLSIPLRLPHLPLFHPTYPHFTLHMPSSASRLVRDLGLVKLHEQMNLQQFRVDRIIAFGFVV